jgi:large conductance mechanosensitive channel
MLAGFKKFVLRGNAVDLAIGVVIGAAFGNLINAIVKNLLTPFIAAIFKAPDFSALSFTIRGSIFQYGELLNALISFLIIALTVYFFVVLPMNALLARFAKETPAPPSTKQCPECAETMALAAKRCPHCTSVLS